MQPEVPVSMVLSARQEQREQEVAEVVGAALWEQRARPEIRDYTDPPEAPAARDLLVPQEVPEPAVQTDRTAQPE